MGTIVAAAATWRCCPAGKAYRFVAATAVASILLQTIEGPDTVYRWAEICQTV